MPLHGAHCTREAPRGRGERTSMKKMVLLRHGESDWNKDNRFTGWVDVGLSKKGEEEALESGRVLKREGYVFDVAYTSVLKTGDQDTLDRS